MEKFFFLLCMTEWLVAGVVAQVRIHREIVESVRLFGVNGRNVTSYHFSSSCKSSQHSQTFSPLFGCVCDDDASAYVLCGT